MFQCSCPNRLASATVEGIINQLVNLFDDKGLGRTWCDVERKGNPVKRVGVTRSSSRDAIDNVVCQEVKGLLDFVQFAHSCNVDLTKGYLLRVVSESGRVLEKPVSYSVVYERLRYYLSTLGIYEGETPHSFRSGCTVTMALSDSASNVDEVMNHVGWFGKASAEYYGRVNTLIDSEIVASNLAASVSQAENIELQYREKADFSGLKRVF
ncbi:Hypothetical predicted protein [Mytilus galloprovincialis]|uniref:Uncharacterized protein n=1 Tax=Mytilus galloprovincialis TaxID=29158 RepID=A0A8B6C634_MYTGA|nr:Hypothetical predicted protein [Mytilus galloprovincialis]